MRSGGEATAGYMLRPSHLSIKILLITGLQFCSLPLDSESSIDVALVVHRLPESTASKQLPLCTSATNFIASTFKSPSKQDEYFRSLVFHLCSCPPLGIHTTRSQNAIQCINRRFAEERKRKHSQTCKKESNNDHAHCRCFSWILRSCS
jgi:hypothetical protein